VAERYDGFALAVEKSFNQGYSSIHQNFSSRPGIGLCLRHRVQVLGRIHAAQACRSTPFVLRYSDSSDVVAKTRKASASRMIVCSIQMNPKQLWADSSINKMTDTIPRQRRR
jgi:hypothetical protein